MGEERGGNDNDQGAWACRQEQGFGKPAEVWAEDGPAWLQLQSKHRSWGAEQEGPPAEAGVSQESLQGHWRESQHEGHMPGVKPRGATGARGQARAAPRCPAGLPTGKGAAETPPAWTPTPSSLLLLLSSVPPPPPRSPAEKLLASRCHRVLSCLPSAKPG